MNTLYKIFTGVIKKTYRDMADPCKKFLLLENRRILNNRNLNNTTKQPSIEVCLKHRNPKDKTLTRIIVMTASRRTKMSIDYVNSQIASRTLKLKNKTAYLSFLSTIWRGEIIFCCYNNTNNSVDNVYSIQEISLEDKAQLEVIIKNFLNQ